jgi:L-ascorbate metabolism protein UlaG (beta-lactamase superfamily)
MRLAVLAAALLAAGPALASNCFQLADHGPRVIPASMPLEADEVGLTFVGHAAFRIQSPEGVTAVTDFAGWWGPGDAPDVVTMNRAHSSHWTANPDPAIPHVLRGWNPDGGEADHWVEIGDMIVRNVPTDIRRWDGTVEPFGNSIFVFEAAGLCIGHLGHLHHKPTEAHYGMIGRLDVVLAPVDGGYTMNLPAMIEVLKRFRARIVIPMHWFGRNNLETFLAGMADEFAIEDAGSASTVVSLDTLPSRPTVRVLMGR